MQVFVSYARSDKEVVARLVRDLDALGCETWIDRRLAGGQEWWDEILSQIHRSDCFILLVTPASNRSEACAAETDWALAVETPVVPIALTSDEMRALPESVSNRQALQLRVEHDVAGALEFAKMLLAVAEQIQYRKIIEAPQPAPPIPRGYGDDYRQRLNRPELTGKEQRVLLAELEHDLGDPVNADEASDLLGMLGEHPDVTKLVADRIEELLRETSPYPTTKSDEPDNPSAETERAEALLDPPDPVRDAPYVREGAATAEDDGESDPAQQRTIEDYRAFLEAPNYEPERLAPLAISGSGEVRRLVQRVEGYRNNTRLRESVMADLRKQVEWELRRM